MKDYIVTVEETYFDATKFDIGGFYDVKYKSTITDEDAETHKCILTSATRKTLTFIYYNHRGCKTELNLTPHSIESGRYVIEEFSGNDNFKDLYFNTAEIKKGKCYELKIDGLTYNGFCSYIDNDVITMVTYSIMGTIGAITHYPTALHFPGEPAIIPGYITSGSVSHIDRNELKEDMIYFKELR